MKFFTWWQPCARYFRRRLLAMVDSVAAFVTRCRRYVVMFRRRRSGVCRTPITGCNRLRRTSFSRATLQRAFQRAFASMPADGLAIWPALRISCTPTGSSHRAPDARAPVLPPASVALGPRLRELQSPECCDAVRDPVLQRACVFPGTGDSMGHAGGPAGRHPGASKSRDRLGVSAGGHPSLSRILKRDGSGPRSPGTLPSVPGAVYSRGRHGAARNRPFSRSRSR